MTGTHPLDLFDLDDLVGDEERAIQQTVREVMDKQVRPHVAQWYDEASLPARELAVELGQVGLLGMHLEGYGCAGTSATAYGLACLELEAADAGVRSLVSVQGSLAMFAIWKHGSDDQEEAWLPRMATGEAIGCFGLAEPDAGSDPASMRTRARRDGADWVLNGSKMWITNGSSDVAIVWAQTDDGIRGFVVPTTPRPGTRRRSAQAVAPRLGDQRAGARRRAAARRRRAARVTGLRGPLSC